MEKHSDLALYGNEMKNLILLNVFALKIKCDIRKTTNKTLFLLKSKWYEEWINYVTKSFALFAPFPMKWYGECDLISEIEKNKPENKWFKNLLIEVCLFTPYFPLGSFNKRVCRKMRVTKDSNSFLDTLFLGKSYYNKEERQNIPKTYSKAYNKVEETVSSNKQSKTYVASIMIFVTIFSFTTFITLFGGITKFSILFSLLGSSFGVVGGLLISVVLGFDNLVNKKDFIMRKAKDLTLKEIS